MSVARVMEQYKQHGDLQRALHEAGYPHLAQAIGQGSSIGPGVEMSKPEIHRSGDVDPNESPTYEPPPPSRRSHREDVEQYESKGSRPDKFRENEEAAKKQFEEEQ